MGEWSVHCVRLRQQECAREEKVRRILGYFSRTRRMWTAACIRAQSGLGMQVREAIQDSMVSGVASPLSIRSLITPTEAAVPTASKASSKSVLQPKKKKVREKENSKLSFSLHTALTYSSLRILQLEKKEVKYRIPKQSEYPLYISSEYIESLPYVKYNLSVRVWYTYAFTCHLDKYFLLPHSVLSCQRD